MQASIVPSVDDIDLCYQQSKRRKKIDLGKSAIGQEYVINQHETGAKKNPHKMFKFFLLLAVLAVALAGNAKVC